MNKQETIEAIKRGIGAPGGGRFDVVSEWVISERDKYEATAYPYLESVAKKIVADHGLELSGTEYDDLHTLVYNAAKVSRERASIAAGWVEATPDWMAAHEGKTVECVTEGMMGNGVAVCTVKRLNGNLRLVPKGKRTRYYHEVGRKVREVK